MCMKSEEIKREKKKKDWIGIIKDFPTDALKELKDMLREREPLIIISFPVFGVMFEHVIEVIKDHEGVVEKVINEIEKGRIMTAEIVCEIQNMLEEKLDRNVTVIIIQKGCAVAVAFL